MSERGAARHLARERALELAYEGEIKSLSMSEVLGAQSMEPDPYTAILVTAFDENRTWAEGLVAKNSTEWPLDRLAIVDRLIMTLALCELRLEEPPPVAVVLDEAVELAKIYSSDNSPSFVNGVLSACVKEMD